MLGSSESPNSDISEPLRWRRLRAEEAIEIASPFVESISRLLSGETRLKPSRAAAPSFATRWAAMAFRTSKGGDRTARPFVSLICHRREAGEVEDASFEPACEHGAACVR
jgi:hypothetical protein